MILKLKSFFLQNGGSYLNLPNSFNWNQIMQKNTNLIKRSFYRKGIKKSEILRPNDIKKIHLLKNIKKKNSKIKINNFELAQKNDKVKGLGMKKIGEIEWVILEKPIKKIKKI